MALPNPLPSKTIGGVWTFAMIAVVILLLFIAIPAMTGRSWATKFKKPQAATDPVA